MSNKDERIVQMISQKALLALMYEVSASPKPGLVDRFNSGAHRDMDFFTFMSSSASLVFYFSACAEAGMQFAGCDPQALFKALRGIGIRAERVMFEATGGVNTHKGLIFSLGIICAASACCVAENRGKSMDVDAICSKVSIMTKGLCFQELSSMSKTEGLTAGERLYKKYGLRGIRGEVEGGFPTVRRCALPVLLQLKSEKKYHTNDIYVQTLLHLMSVNEDTNVAARHDMEALEYVKQNARRALDAGGMLTDQGKELVFEMDRVFIEKHISPGGSADLLAVAIMFEQISEWAAN